MIAGPVLFAIYPSHGEGVLPCAASAAGNTFIWKPSEQDLSPAVRVAELFWNPRLRLPTELAGRADQPRTQETP
jgi:hypothetical protein